MQFDRPESPQKMAPPPGQHKIGERMPEGPLWTPKEVEEEKKRRQSDPDWLRESE